MTLQRRVDGRDKTSGDVKVSWVSVGDVWAAVEPVSVREFIAGQSQQSQVTARITVRYRDDLTATMRILHRNRIFNPQGWLSDPDSGLEYMTAPCSEGVNDGR